MKAEEHSAAYTIVTQPAGWRRAKLGELLPIKYGKSLPEKLRDVTGSCPVFGSSGRVGAHSAALTSGPTLIIGRKGNVGAIHYSSEACWPIDTVYYVETPKGQNLRYYKYLLDSLNLVKLDKSTAVPGLSRDDYNAVEVAVAPPDQQERIVAEIEKQFSRLDEAVANLKRVKANLKRYKAAVLKAAVEGRLVETEAERVEAASRRLKRPEAASTYESGAQLLQRILETRRSQWQGKGKYKEPAAPDTTDLPELPEGWVWARLDTIAALKGGITVDNKRKNPTARSVPYLRVANVQRGYLDLDEVKFIEAPETEIEALRLMRGDILFNEGGDRDKLGRGWIWEDQLADCIHQNHVFRTRLYLDQISPKLVSWWGNSFGKDYFSREGKQTTNLASINLTKLSAFPVPIPPTAEQQEIVAEIDRRFSQADEAEAQINANLQRAYRLRQAILSRAFTPSIVAS